MRAKFLIDHVHAHADLGGAADRLTEQLGAPEDLLVRPRSHVPLSLLERYVLQAIRDTSLALAWKAVPASLEEVGPFGVELARQPTLYEALRAFVALVGTESSLTNFFLERRTRALWVCRGKIPASGTWLLHTERYNVGFLLALVRHWAGAAWVPTELWLQGEATGEDGELAAIDRVRYRSPLLAFPVPESLLYRIRVGRPEPSATPSPYGPRVDLDHLSFVESLGRVVECYLSAGPPRIDRLASLLGTSPRSLQRHLAEQGATFSRVVADVRRGKAVEQLSGSSRPITEIAGDLGYSDSAHFARAFRGWFGIGPREFRRMNREA